MSSRVWISASFALAGLLLAGRQARAAERVLSDPPGVRIWTDHGEVYRRGERVQVFFRTEHDAYVTVLRVDTDGRVRVLFPRDPGDANLARGGETYTVPGVDDRYAFTVDDAPGVGYVFAVASDDPFTYDPFEADDRWSFQEIANLSDGRVHGDPYASLQSLVQQIMAPGYADYDTHLLPYDVEQHYDYPRFLCYDCHAYTPYAYWDPYDAWCPQFSLAVYFNPFYYYPSYWYPTRYYRGVNVVYVRPGFVGRQFVFRNRAPGAAPYTVYRDRRNGWGDGPADRGVRGVDIGGVGSVPSPGGRRAIPGSADQVNGRRTIGGADQVSGGRRVMTGENAEAAGTFAPRQPAAAPQDAGRRAVRDFIPEPETNPRVVGPSPVAPRSDAAPTQPRPRGVYIDAGAAPSAAAGRPEAREGVRYIPQEAPRSESRGAPGYGAAEAPKGGSYNAPREAPQSAPAYAPGGSSRGGGSMEPAARAAPRAAPAPRSTPALVRRRG
ncbi:MAG TPA: DUF4384 domain-containing protein [Gemmatimonadales bacterium]|nr:DUF4384 domain-containing protein [Gemmatimonadales bacterium]